MGMTIHDRIYQLRTASRLSQEALGEIVGVSYQTVQQWEKGKTAPSRKRVDDVAKALNTSVEYLLFGTSNVAQAADTIAVGGKNETGNVSNIPQYSLDKNEFRPVYVIERPPEGMPERLWDGETLVGATEQFAVLATSDPRAFLIPIVDTSMVPRFNPGEFALVEPAIEVDLEDDVLVRLKTGETLLKRLVSRRGGVQLSAYSEPGTTLHAEEEISWMFYVAHPVPSKKIKR